MSQKAVKPKSNLEQICLDIEPEQKKAMEKIREKSGVPVAFQIRTAIDAYLKKNKEV